MNDKVIEKIQKLLSLANSPNEHEAKLATEKANELLIKFNLSMQDVSKESQKEYLEKTVEDSKRRSAESYHVTQIIVSHFFVKALMRTVNRRTTVYFLGEATNVQIASYVYSYLIRAYRECWEKHRELYDSPVKAKHSYYSGLSYGLSEQLKVKRKSVEAETGLMVIEDPDLVEKVSKYKHAKHRKESNRDTHAEYVGYQDGLQLRIKRGIENQSEDNGLYLEKK